MGDLEYRARVRGCILGGAVGGALGGPVESWDGARIARACGPSGVREFLPHTQDGEERYGVVTDDTQMTLFTVEGLIRAGVRTDRGIGFTFAVTHNAYDRWLDTQLLRGPDGTRDGWVVNEPWLYARRGAGTTTLSALMDARGGGRTVKRIGMRAENHSKGCGAVARSAPFGLLPPGSDKTLRGRFDAAAEAASYTHGHVTAQLAAGALVALIGAIVAGEALSEAVATMMQHLGEHAGHEETSAAVRRAICAAEESPSIEMVESFGGGWVAEEALAIAVYVALAHPGPESFLDALSLAVTHSGDSDSIGAICGSILGALHGEAALPPELTFEVEGRGAILELADDFIYEFTSGHRLHGDYGPYTRWTKRYPGW